MGLRYIKTSGQWFNFYPSVSDPDFQEFGLNIDMTIINTVGCVSGRYSEGVFSFSQDKNHVIYCVWNIANGQHVFNANNLWLKVIALGY